MLKLKKVHEDKRGIIYVFKINGVEQLLIFTKKGHCRAGHIHDEIQYTMVLDGIVEWTQWECEHETVRVMYKGEVQTTPTNMPHLLKAVTDCWILEIKKNPKNKTANMMTKYYRGIVESTR